jgi:hypothetical protein
MDFAQFCERCKYYGFDSKKGIVCRLSNLKPAFEKECKNFLLDPERDRKKATQSTYTRSRKMKRALDKWGVALTTVGIINLIWGVVGGFYFLTLLWGVVFILLGIINIKITRREIFIVNGIALILLGLTYFWEEGGLAGRGILAIIWGCWEFYRFMTYKVSV